MRLNYLLFLVSLVLSVQVYAERLVLSDIMPPDDLENIHVVKLASDSYSTDFVIFVKNKVPLHKHVEHSEMIYVLEGKGLFQLGDQSMEIIAGDYIRVPKGTPHSVKVLSSIPLKIISVQAPEFFGKDRVKVNEFNND
ncbi:MAG: mannose-6-phosphate isomerase-like protein (cupin superfamily) [Gammaproteobacteria bacterium]|jgi:mannose-6-phosphate isomerase-like protein (cupin superfamily)